MTGRTHTFAHSGIVTNASRNVAMLGTATRLSSEPQLGAERHLRGTPYIYVLEAPKSAIVAQENARLRTRPS